MRNKPAPQVVVETINERSIIRTYEAPGRVVAKYRVDVLARIAGYLTKSYFKEGDYVKQGQTLFQIEPTEFSNSEKVAQANVANLKAQLASVRLFCVMKMNLLQKITLQNPNTTKCYHKETL